MDVSKMHKKEIYQITLRLMMDQLNALKRQRRQDTNMLVCKVRMELIAGSVMMLVSMVKDQILSAL